MHRAAGFREGVFWGSTGDNRRIDPGRVHGKRRCQHSSGQAKASRVHHARVAAGGCVNQTPPVTVRGSFPIRATRKGNPPGQRRVAILIALRRQHLRNGRDRVSLSMNSYCSRRAHGCIASGLDRCRWLTRRRDQIERACNVYLHPPPRMLGGPFATAQYLLLGPEIPERAIGSLGHRKQRDDAFSDVWFVRSGRNNPPDARCTAEVPFSVGVAARGIEDVCQPARRTAPGGLQ